MRNILLLKSTVLLVGSDCKAKLNYRRLVVKRDTDIDKKDAEMRTQPTAGGCHERQL